MVRHEAISCTLLTSFRGGLVVPSDASRGRGRGSSNAEERWHRAAQALAHGRQRNRDVGAAILVEGRRDRLALERLGFTGPIEVLNRGWPVDNVLVFLVESYGRRSEADGDASVILLMDWDRTGGRLQAQCRRNLESLDVCFDEHLRSTLMVCLKPETRVVEGLSGLIDALGPLIDQYDDNFLNDLGQGKEMHLP